MSKDERFLVGMRFRPEHLEGKYDAIVIGSGIGGLSAAALLTKAGMRVLVLERHYMAGGFTHAYKRRGYEWDVGVHYIGGVQHPRSTLRRLFDYITDGRLQWARINDDAYDRMVIGGESYDFVSGVDRFRERMSDYFPRERGTIDAYLERVMEVDHASRTFFANKAMPSFISGVSRPFMNRRFHRLSDRTTREVISDLSGNERLLGVLSGQWGDYGLPPGKSSFAIHAMVARHYLDGASFPVGGASSIARGIVTVIKAGGGAVYTSAQVDQVKVHDGKAVGVRLWNGVEIDAPVVISAVGIYNTLENLLTPEQTERMGFKAELGKIGRSISHICLYVGLRESARSLGLKQTNLWVYPGYNHDENVLRYHQDSEAPFPLTFISFPSSKDPDWDRRYPGRSTIEAVGYAPYEWFSKWDETSWQNRGEEYLALKQKLSERMLRELYKAVPQVEGKIDYHELSTPLSTRHFTGYRHGEIYGINHTPERFRQAWLRPGTPLKQFFLAGQDIVTDGVGGALFSGVLCASAVLKRNVLKQVLQS